MAGNNVELVLDCKCDLGEGPIYDDRTQILYFVDINRNTIHAYNTATNKHTSLQLPEAIGAVALTTDANLLLAATGRNIELVRIHGDTPGIIKTIATTPESDGTDDMRFNDCKVTPQGALLAGRMHSAWRKGNPGKVYSLTPGPTPELKGVMDTVGLPNGMAWNTTLSPPLCYFIDSAKETITAYKVDENGIIRPETENIISSKPTNHANVPDGMTIDSEGHLWVAIGESGSIVRIDAKTGEEMMKIELKVKRPTSCGFGGQNLEELYITTRVESGEGASEHHGGLFRVKIEGVRGLAPDYYYKLE